jgi:hypothetical protein
MKRHVGRRMVLVGAFVASALTLGFHVEEGDSTQTLGPGEAGFLAHAPPAHGPLHQQAIDVAETYLFHGLVEHDGDLVLLADDCHRTEQGRSTGDNAAEIRASLESPALAVVTGISNIRWFVECNRSAACEAVAIYDLEVNAFGPAPPVLIAERFRVEDGLIQEIEAVFVIHGSFERCSGACFPPSELGHEAP